MQVFQGRHKQMCAYRDGPKNYYCSQAGEPACLRWLSIGAWVRATSLYSVEEFPPQMIANPLYIFMEAKKRLHQPGECPLPRVDCEWAQLYVGFLKVITAARLSRQQQL